MKARNQPQPQDDNAQLMQEMRRDMLRFELWLETPDGKRWLDAEEQEDLARHCVLCWEA